MASWLKKSKNEIIIHQTSDLPYPWDEQGTFLCDENIFQEHKIRIGHHISFKINRKFAKRLSASCWRLKKFPMRIRTADIECVVNQNTDPNHDISKIVILKSAFVKTAGKDTISDLVEGYDLSYILSKNTTSDSKIHAIDFWVDGHIQSGDSWHRTILHLLDKLCLGSSRNKNWTCNIPETTLKIHGIEQMSEWDEVKKAVDDFKVNDKIDLIYG